MIDAATRRLPVPILLAPLLPTLLLLAARTANELGATLPTPDGATLLFLWALTTLPLLLVVLGLRSLVASLQRDEAALQEAAKALARGEAVAGATVQLLRRAESLAAPGPQAAPAQTPPRRRWALPALVVLLLALSSGTAYVLVREPPELPHHHHATFALFVDGQRVDYTDARFDLSERGYLEAHLHAPDQDLVHLEGLRHATVRDLLEKTLLARLQPDGLALDSEVHGGAVHREGDGRTLRLYVQHDGGAWEKMEDVAGYEPRDRDRILLTFGVEDEEALRAQQAAVSDRFP